MAEAVLEFPEQTHTVATLKAALALQLSGFADACEQVGRVRVAVNHDMVSDEAIVPDMAEVAFFPPVTGG